jgi:hypothetical protein
MYNYILNIEHLLNVFDISEINNEITNKDVLSDYRYLLNYKWKEMPGQDIFEFELYIVSDYRYLLNYEWKEMPGQDIVYLTEHFCSF